MFNFAQALSISGFLLLGLLDQEMLDAVNAFRVAAAAFLALIVASAASYAVLRKRFPEVNGALKSELGSGQPLADIAETPEADTARESREPPPQPNSASGE
jgi:hypothetical protein